MARKDEKIRKHIPEILRKEVAKSSGFDLSVQEEGRSLSDELCKKINAFINEYNLSKAKKLEHIGKDNLIRSLFSSPNDRATGFTRRTAEILCCYAFNGKKDWDTLLSENPELCEGYIFPNEKENKEIITETVNTDTSIPANTVDLNDYLQKFIKQFETIFFPVAKELTTIPIEQIVLPELKYVSSISSITGKESTKQEPETATDICNEIEHSHKLIIVGEGGSGKSSLCRWLYHHYAKQCLASQGIYFPVYLNLNSKISLKNSLLQDFGLESLSISSIASALKSFIVVFVCDALDEAGVAGFEIRNELEELTQLFGSYRVVVTTRQNDCLPDFLNHGYKQFSIIKGNTDSLPKLLIKKIELLKDFEKYDAAVKLSDPIRSNYLLYTCFILDFISGHSSSKTNKAQILKRILEDYYFKIWQSSKENTQKKIPAYRKEGVLDTLSVIACMVNYPELFEKRNRYYYYKDNAIFAEDGLPHECIKNIIALAMSSAEISADVFIEFYCEGGMLKRTTTDKYVFTNRVIEDYFVARGICFSCFSRKPLRPFTEDVSLLNNLKREFLAREDIKTLVIELVPNGNHLLKQTFLEYSDWKRSEIDYRQHLLFVAAIIAVRQTELDDALVKHVMERLVYYSSKRFYSYDTPFFEKILFRKEEKQPLQDIDILLATKCEMAFDIVFDHYVKSQNYPAFPESKFWVFFKSIHRNANLYAYCKDVFQCYARQKDHYNRLEFLYIYYPIQTINYFTELLKQNKPLSLPCNTLLHNLWKFEGNEKSENRVVLKQFAQIVLHNRFNATDSATRQFCSFIIMSCPKEMSNEFFFGPIVQLVKENDIPSNKGLMLEFLRVCSISIEEFSEYLPYFESLLNFDDLKIANALFVLFRIHYKSTGPLPPFVVSSLLSGIKSPYLETVVLCLDKGKYYSPDIFPEFDKTFLADYLFNDEPTLRKSAINLIAAWKIKELIGYVVVYVCRPQERSLTAIAAAYNYLISHDIYYFGIVKALGYEQIIHGMINQIIIKTVGNWEATFMEMEDEFKTLIKCLENFGTENSIVFINELVANNDHKNGSSLVYRGNWYIKEAIQEIEKRVEEYRKHLEENLDAEIKAKNTCADVAIFNPSYGPLTV